MSEGLPDWADDAAREIVTLLAIGSSGPPARVLASLIRRHEFGRDGSDGGRLTLRHLHDAVDGPLLRVSQVSALCQMAEDTVRDLVDGGDLRGVRIGKNYRLVWASVRNYLVRVGALPLPPAEVLGAVSVSVADAPGPRLMDGDKIEAMSSPEIRSAIALRRAALVLCGAALCPSVLVYEVEQLQAELSGRVDGAEGAIS